MNSRLPKALGLCVVALTMFSSILAVPVNAAVAPAPPPPVWVTINSSASGNYPGGNELFTVFVVNTAVVRMQNETIENATLTAPFASNFGPGLPTTIAPGHSLLLTIYLQIPSNFSQPSFTANLVVHVTLLNGTSNVPLTVTGIAPVNVFSLTPQTATQSGSQTTAPAGQAGTVSTTLFAVGVAVPSIVAIILLALLVRARGSSRRMGP